MTIVQTSTRLVLVLAGVLVGCGGDGGGSDGGSDGGVDGAAPMPAEFGLDTRPPNATCKAPARPPAAGAVTWNRVYPNLALGTAMMMVQLPGDGSRWFVARREGNVVSFPTANPGTTPTIVANLPALSGKAINQNGEGGFLGLAFHPRFAQTGDLYVSWTTTGGANGMRSEVGALHSTDGGASFTSYRTVLAFDQTTATNHKGGSIAFGKDGYLYLGFGDGGGGGDTFQNGQKKTGYFAKVLRIDVDQQPFAIPPTNPWATGGGEPATYSWGMRNPFRFSIDRATGELWVGDVGQDMWEEVDRVAPGGNYGWPCREGAHDYSTDPTLCPSRDGLLDPVAEHQHLAPYTSRAITGGVVYRGKAIPGFAGTYVYGDYVTQELFTFGYDATTGNPVSTKLDGAPAAPWVHFAEDVDGEVYAVALNGQVYQLAAAQPGPPSTFPQTLSATGCADPTDVTKPAAGLIPYGVRSPLWSDGAQKERWMALPDGKTIDVGADGDFDLPIGTVLVKSFSLAGKRIETRLLVRHDDGGWAGYTYEWLDDQSDAVLLPSSKTKTVGAQSWYYPSRSDCLHCHTEAAGRSLGLELGQLAGDYVYASTNRIADQLKTLEHLGLFTQPLPAARPVYPTPTDDATGTLEARARAYLHANCSHCHRPNGGGLGNMDLRFQTAFKDTATCNVTPDQGTLGVAGAMLLVPGAPAQSVISLRPHTLGANRMPPLASAIVDDAGLAVLDAWITSVTACP